MYCYGLGFLFNTSTAGSIKQVTRGSYSSSAVTRSRYRERKRKSESIDLTAAEAGMNGCIYHASQSNPQGGPQSRGKQPKQRLHEKEVNEQAADSLLMMDSLKRGVDRERTRAGLSRGESGL